MGFRCPFCKADFGHDKEAFDKHMKDENKSFSMNGLTATNLADTLKTVLADSVPKAEYK